VFAHQHNDRDITEADFALTARPDSIDGTSMLLGRQRCPIDAVSRRALYSVSLSSTGKLLIPAQPSNGLSDDGVLALTVHGNDPCGALNSCNLQGFELTPATAPWSPSPSRRDYLPRARLVQACVEGRGGGVLVEHASAELEIRQPRDLGQHLHRPKRIPAQVEEVVVFVDVWYLENLGPEPHKAFRANTGGVVENSFILGQ
jgi:hypothetical protein